MLSQKLDIEQMMILPNHRIHGSGGGTQLASNWVRITRNIKPIADAQIATLVGAVLPTPTKPMTEGLLFSSFFFTTWQSYTR